VPAPELLSPASDASFGVWEGVSFSWNPVSVATEYEIEIDDRSDFSSSEVHHTIGESYYSLDAGVIKSGSYYWRVRGKALEWGEWSE
jgi:hypothetical protein